MNYKHLFLLFFTVILFNSCEDDTDCCPMPEEEAEFESGIFVLNEGNFGSGNASVSFIDKDMQQMQSSIFMNTNETGLGDTAQSIKLYEEVAIIVVNVSNKIEVVNRYTFESLATIDVELMNPRYAEVVNDKIYVSNWGDGMNPDDDFVAVFDLADFSFIKSISVAEGPEKVLAANEKLFVAHKGGFSFNNIVSVINTGTNGVDAEIEVGDLPNSMVFDGNSLWVLSGGKPSYAETETAGKLSNINISNNQVEEEFDFPDSSLHPNNLSLEGSEVYLTIGKTVYSYNMNTMQPASEFKLEEPALLYGFEIHDGKIYVASPNADFTGDGMLYVYDLLNGSLTNQFSVGINPNGIYFND
ncbi:MAG: YncE family protein [Christiangramia sp.]|nr:YncE family protein [Christiangramia sp.]